MEVAPTAKRLLGWEARDLLAPLWRQLAEALGTHLDLFQRIVVSPASVSAISYSETGPNVVLTNWTGPSGQGPAKSGPGSTAARNRP